MATASKNVGSAIRDENDVAIPKRKGLITRGRVQPDIADPVRRAQVLKTMNEYQFGRKSGYFRKPEDNTSKLNLEDSTKGDSTLNFEKDEEEEEEDTIHNKEWIRKQQERRHHRNYQSPKPMELTKESIIDSFANDTSVKGDESVVSILSQSEIEKRQNLRRHKNYQPPKAANFEEEDRRERESIALARRASAAKKVETEQMPIRRDTLAPCRNYSMILNNLDNTGASGNGNNASGAGSANASKQSNASGAGNANSSKSNSSEDKTSNSTITTRSSRSKAAAAAAVSSGAKEAGKKKKVPAPLVKIAGLEISAIASPAGGGGSEASVPSSAASSVDEDVSEDLRVLGLAAASKAWKNQITSTPLSGKPPAMPNSGAAAAAAAGGQTFVVPKPTRFEALVEPGVEEEEFETDEEEEEEFEAEQDTTLTSKSLSQPSNTEKRRENLSSHVAEEIEDEIDDEVGDIPDDGKEAALPEESSMINRSQSLSDLVLEDATVLTEMDEEVEEPSIRSAPPSPPPASRRFPQRNRKPKAVCYLCAK